MRCRCRPSAAISGVQYYTTSSAILEALDEAGVRYIFANLGSDHPGILEALAQAKAAGRESRLPRLVICPHETVALSAAHAYAMISGHPQAVIVHVDSGTQNLGGAVNNAMRGRVPVLIFAGSAPYTLYGELPGSRNEFIHWVQDVRDQRGILRNYVKYDNEIRTGRNVKQMVHRALQIARSEPAGPVYLTCPREVMEEQVEPYAVDPVGFGPVAPAALTGEVTAEIATALAGARYPLIVTSYLGRDPAAVPKLVELAELLGIRVIEAAAYHVNFPAGHPLHAGYQFHSVAQNPVLAQADVILVIDSDVPWIPAVNRPSADAAIYCVDMDPLKSQMNMWHVQARRFAAANSRVAVEQIALYVLDKGLIDSAAVDARRSAATRAHELRMAEQDETERKPADGVITPEYLTACVRRLFEAEDALFLTEVVTNSRVVSEHLRPDKPGSVLHHGGGSLGWAGGAAVGAKLAFPERTVVSLVGDGSYLFGAPSSAQWVARRYGVPSLTIIYDNRGWAAPKFSALQVHPDGAAAAADDFHVSFEPEVDLPGVAAAAGAYGVTVADPDELPAVLKDALAAVRGGRSAVVSVHLAGV
jgi:acetolactate synthase I/II/III large subunit